MEEFIKEALERATLQGVEMERLRICSLIADKLRETNDIDISLALMELLNELKS